MDTTDKLILILAVILLGTVLYGKYSESYLTDAEKAALRKQGATSS